MNAWGAIRDTFPEEIVSLAYLRKWPLLKEVSFTEDCNIDIVALDFFHKMDNATIVTGDAGIIREVRTFQIAVFRGLI